MDDRPPEVKRAEAAIWNAIAAGRTDLLPPLISQALTVGALAAALHRLPDPCIGSRVKLTPPLPLDRWDHRREPVRGGSQGHLAAGLSGGPDQLSNRPAGCCSPRIPLGCHRPGGAGRWTNRWLRGSSTTRGEPIDPTTLPQPGVNPDDIRATKEYGRAEAAIEVVAVDLEVQAAAEASDQAALDAALLKAERLGFEAVLRRAWIAQQLGVNRDKVRTWLEQKEREAKARAKVHRREEREERRKAAEEVRRKEDAAKAHYETWKRERDAELRQTRQLQAEKEEIEIRHFLERENRMKQK